MTSTSTGSAAVVTAAAATVPPVASRSTVRPGTAFPEADSTWIRAVVRSDPRGGAAMSISRVYGPANRAASSEIRDFAAAAPRNPGPSADGSAGSMTWRCGTAGSSFAIADRAEWTSRSSESP